MNPNTHLPGTSASLNHAAVRPSPSGTSTPEHSTNGKSAFRDVGKASELERQIRNHEPANQLSFISSEQHVNTRKTENINSLPLLTHDNKAEITEPSPPALTSNIEWIPENYKKNSKSQSDDAKNLAHKLINSVLIELPIERICDLGCGTGNNLHTYREMFQSKLIYAVDPQKDMLDVIPPPDSNSFKTEIQQATAEKFTFEKTSKPTIIFSTHAFHWISPLDMEKTLQNIFNQLDDNEGHLAAFFSDSKKGLPFQKVLNQLKNDKEFKTKLTEFKTTQFFHEQKTMEEQLKKAGFSYIQLNSDLVDKTFKNKDELQGFVKQWLPEYHHLKKVASNADDNFPDKFLEKLIENYLAHTNQKDLQPVQWSEKSFTLIASKNAKLLNKPL